VRNKPFALSLISPWGSTWVARMHQGMWRTALVCAAAGFAAPSDAGQNTQQRTNEARRALSGIASVYDHTSGSNTASGERLKESALTGAHPSLPFGTVVEVSNKHNGRKVLVRINDRGPFVRGRVIDLTPAAAGALQFHGTTEVSLRVVSDHQ
jgi:rare lipoprotein A